MWCQDEAGPYSTSPYQGKSWQREGKPQQQGHEYLPDGTAKLLTLFHPNTGQVVVKGVTSSNNTVLHGWLQAQLLAILARLPSQDMTPSAANRVAWEKWQEGLTIRPTLPVELPPLRMVLVTIVASLKTLPKAEF